MEVGFALEISFKSRTYICNYKGIWREIKFLKGIYEYIDFAGICVYVSLDNFAVIYMCIDISSF